MCICKQPLVRIVLKCTMNLSDFLLNLGYDIPLFCGERTPPNKKRPQEESRDGSDAEAAHLKRRKKVCSDERHFQTLSPTMAKQSRNEIHSMVWESPLQKLTSFGHTHMPSERRLFSNGIWLVMRLRRVKDGSGSLSRYLPSCRSM